jgi:tetratricopeptide (TPR) repeat protein
MQGHLDAAVAIYDHVLAVARAAGDHRTIVSALASKGGQYSQRGDYAQAERALREAREDGLKLGNPRLLSVPTLNLGSVLGDQGRAEEARPLVEEALAMARQSGDFEVQSKALLLLANDDYSKGNIEDASRSYREVRDSKSLAGAPGNPLGSAHRGLAAILRETGQLKAAAEAAEQAVVVNREANDRPGLGYSLVQRALIRSDLGIDLEAAHDLDEAAKLASAPKAPLVAVGLRVAVGRAVLAMRRSQWSEAERELARVRSAPETADDVGFDGRVRVLSAEVAIGLGQWADAIRYASRVEATPAASPVDRATARVLLARAHAQTADRDAASSEAKRGLADAERLGLPYVEALACSVLLDLGVGADVEAIRARGRKALDHLFDIAPEASRENLRARNDLQVMIRAFERMPS